MAGLSWITSVRRESVYHRIGRLLIAGRKRMRLVGILCLIIPMTITAAAHAADADNGKRLVEARCVSCHSMGLRERRQLSEAPSFPTIASKLGSNSELLAYSLLDPHPRMNEPLTRREAQDIAAYIATLAP
jgi:mono/diheme cytochrome c family protein